MVAELVDAHVSEACVAIHGGSSPLRGTMIMDSDIQTTIDTLKKLTPGNVPEQIFVEFSRHNVLTSIELFLFNIHNEVLLTRRNANDPVWPNMWHNPGTIVRPNDIPHGLDYAVNRIYNSELHIASYEKPKQIQQVLLSHERGNGIGYIYIGKLESTTVGEFFDIHHFPQDTITASAHMAKIAYGYIVKNSF